MEASEFLRLLCRRYDVPFQQAQSLMPLIRRERTYIQCWANSVRRGESIKIHNHGDKLDLLVCLNQDTMDRHLRLMGPGARVIFNSDAIQPGEAGEGVQLCPIPVKTLTDNSKN